MSLFGATPVRCVVTAWLRSDHWAILLLGQLLMGLGSSPRLWT